MKDLKLLLVFLCMLFSSMSITAHDFESYGIYYNITSEEEKTVEVTWCGEWGNSYGMEYSGNVGLPSMVLYNNSIYYVTGIGLGAFTHNHDLECVNIPSSVKYINDGAFDNCYKLSKITIEGDLDSIGDNVFRETAWYNNQPDGLIYVGDILYGYKGQMPANTNIDVREGTKSIAAGAFSGCNDLISINIPESVTKIGYRAFADCCNLSSIKIPSSITSMGLCCFDGTAYWENLPDGLVYYGSILYGHKGYISGDITIEEGTTTIMDYALSQCGGISSITLPESLEYIGDNAFEGCNTWILSIPSNVRHIGKKAFAMQNLSYINVDEENTIYDSRGYCNAIIETATNKLVLACYNSVLPSDISIIGSYAYSGNLPSQISIPEGVNIIEDYAFCYDEFSDGMYVPAITIPETIEEIGDCAFMNYISLNSVNLPNVKKIGANAFYGCFNLSNINVSGDLEEVGSDAFWGTLWYENQPNGVVYIGNAIYDYKGPMPENTNIEIKEGVKYIRANMFSGSENLASLSIPASVICIGYEAFKNCNLSRIVVDVQNPVYDSRNNSNAIIETKSNVLIQGSANTIIPNSIVRIEDRAFYGIKGLDSVSIPNSVKSIGMGAFANSSLNKVTLGNGVVDMADSPFMETNISEITIPENVKYIGQYGFYGCKNLSQVNFQNKMWLLRQFLFSGCPNLKTITIPESIKRIDNGAFRGSTNLKEIISLSPTPPACYYSPFSDIDKENCRLIVPENSVDAYKAAEYWSEFRKIFEMGTEELTLTLNQYGKSTYCSEYALDFTNVEGLKAYVATGYNTRTGVVTMTRVMTTKGGTGLFLKGEQGSYQVPVIAESDDNTLNLLVGTLEKVTVNSEDDTYTNYKFTVKAGETEPGFYKFADNSTLSANKAYLHIPTAWLPSTSAAKSVRMWFEDEEATGIDEINTNRPDSDTIYDMQGRRVKNPSKGMYIVNGKKMIIK